MRCLSAVAELLVIVTIQSLTLMTLTEYTTDLYKYSSDAVPPIHAVSSTDKPLAQDGDKFRSIFSDNLQPIATRGKKARGTLLVNQHCGNGCSIKRAPLSDSYITTKLAAAILGSGLFGGGVLPAQYCPCGVYEARAAATAKARWRHAVELSNNGRHAELLI